MRRGYREGTPAPPSQARPRWHPGPPRPGLRAGVAGMLGGVILQAGALSPKTQVARRSPARPATGSLPLSGDHAAGVRDARPYPGPRVTAARCTEVVATANPYDGLASPVHSGRAVRASRVRPPLPGIGRRQRLLVTHRDGRGHGGPRPASSRRHAQERDDVQKRLPLQRLAAVHLVPLSTAPSDVQMRLVRRVGRARAGWAGSGRVGCAGWAGSGRADAPGGRGRGVQTRRVGGVGACRRDGSVGATTSTRSPPSTGWVPAKASRSTVPATGAVIDGLHLHRLDRGDGRRRPRPGRPRRPRW